MKTEPWILPAFNAMTARQKIDRLVRAIAERDKLEYWQAYRRAFAIIHAPGPGTYSERLCRAGKAPAAIAALIKHHRYLNDHAL